MSQISPSGEGMDRVIESGEHLHAPIGERMARLEAQIPYLAKQASVEQLRTEMARFATKEEMSKEIHKARNWLMAAMFAMFATQQLQFWLLQ